MRILIAPLLVAALGGCTALLVGGGPGEMPNSRSASQVTEDSATSARISSRLASDPVVGKYDIGVYTYADRVTLSGSVGSEEARSRAHDIAARVHGVISVENDIRVTGDP